ncbi:MAG TPA: alanyl-tRNA editing protein [Anaerolineales bacterium]|nr:alanyl-tRNA editing protein [Anaerolineales bacterium]
MDILLLQQATGRLPLVVVDSILYSVLPAFARTILITGNRADSCVEKRQNCCKIKNMPTERLYLQDSYCFETEAVVSAVQPDSLAFDRTCFYPGGGGQPPDEGFVRLNSGETFEIHTAYADTDETIWHACQPAPSPNMLGQPVRLSLNTARRLALMRYHTVLHILNTIALRDYQGWITGVQIGSEYSRIDFKLEGFSAALCAEMEQKVNTVIAGSHGIKSYHVSEEEFQRRGDLLRTLEVKPPVSHGQVRVVEIEGFDAQACGGTHVHNTSEAGRFSIFRTENKGRINKRLYVRLEQV